MILGNSPRLEAVSERDIDLLLLEELSVCGEFGRWFLSKTWGDGVSCMKSFGVWHSITEQLLGESDLVWVFEDIQCRRVALLLEDKIAAPPQPEQAARYRMRGESGVREGDWAEFRTVLVAPSRYLLNDREAKGYDYQLSYEDLVAWFEGRGDERSCYKAQVIQLGIEQQRRGYCPKADEQVSSFFADYWQIASREFPMLEMPAPGGIPVGNDWIGFKPQGLHFVEAFRHKLATGAVDLQLKGDMWSLETSEVIWNPEHDPEILLVQTGKSVSLRVVVPYVDRARTVEEQLDEIRTGMRAAARLVTLAREIQKRGIHRADSSEEPAPA